MLINSNNVAYKTSIQRDDDMSLISKSINTALSNLNDVGKESVLKLLSARAENETAADLFDSKGTVDVTAIQKMTDVAVKETLKEAADKGISVLMTEPSVSRDEIKSEIIGQSALFAMTASELKKDLSNMSKEQRAEVIDSYLDFDDEKQGVIFDKVIEDKINDESTSREEMDLLQMSREQRAEWKRLDKNDIEGLLESVKKGIEILRMDHPEQAALLKKMLDSGGDIAEIYNVKLRFIATLEQSTARACNDGERLTAEEYKVLSTINMDRNTDNIIHKRRELQSLVKDGSITQEEYLEKLEALNKKTESLKNEHEYWDIRSKEEKEDRKYSVYKKETYYINKEKEEGKISPEQAIKFRHIFHESHFFEMIAKTSSIMNLTPELMEFVKDNMKYTDGATISENMVVDFLKTHKKIDAIKENEYKKLIQDAQITDIEKDDKPIDPDVLKIVTDLNKSNEEIEQALKEKHLNTDRPKENTNSENVKKQDEISTEISQIPQALLKLNVPKEQMIEIMKIYSSYIMDNFSDQETLDVYKNSTSKTIVGDIVDDLSGKIDDGEFETLNPQYKDALLAIAGIQYHGKLDEILLDPEKRQQLFDNLEQTTARLNGDLSKVPITDSELQKIFPLQQHEVQVENDTVQLGEQRKSSTERVSAKVEENGNVQVENDGLDTKQNDKYKVISNLYPETSKESDKPKETVSNTNKENEEQKNVSKVDEQTEGILSSEPAEEAKKQEDELITSTTALTTTNGNKFVAKLQRALAALRGSQEGEKQGFFSRLKDAFEVFVPSKNNDTDKITESSTTIVGEQTAPKAEKETTNVVETAKTLTGKSEQVLPQNLDIYRVDDKTQENLRNAVKTHNESKTETENGTKVEVVDKSKEDSDGPDIE